AVNELRKVTDLLEKAGYVERRGIAERVRQAESSSGQQDKSQGKGQQKSEATSEAKIVQKMARQRRDQLDRVPDDLGGRVKALREYEFMDAQAGQKFQELLDRLQKQMVDQMFQGMKQSIERMTAKDLTEVRNMVRELNRMLEDRARGMTPDFAGFMERFGDMFPPGIESLDQLLDHLQRQMAQMQSLLKSMSPEAREELSRMMDELLGDDALRLELARLGAMMEALMPPSDLSERYPFFGEEPATLEQAMGLMDRLQGIDRLESQLERGSFRLDDVDRGLAEELLGPQARDAVNELRKVTDLLEKAGYVERRGRGLELTPKGMRQIGRNALRDIFERLRKGQVGQHRVFQTGVGGEAGEDLKDYEYGDPFLVDLKETLFNSLEREGRGVPLQIEPADFVVRRTDHSSQVCTVLMVDMSRSMFLRGCFLAAKKVAMALDALIRAQYPRDKLYVVGFSNQAVELKADALPQITLNDYVYGTNMQHGFQLARSLLARHRGNKQIIMVTDGEPTAHLENGRVYFAYPPTFRTIQETLKEVQRCTRDRIVINTFMLERGPYLTEFINRVTKLNRGRAFFVQPERLGEYILVDYVSGRQQRRHSRAS
ncbi:MAG: VWA domain-containing protein, partial [Candidatus Dormibacteraeota bacterium]|nr:VWA domain-containing protein [Candidatus Dormibacteraeota bacterium]